MVCHSLPCLPPNPRFQCSNLFADPHPLTPVASIFYKNIGGQGALLSFQRPHVQPSNVSTCFLFSPNSFPCHTSENSLVSPTIATLPKTPVSNPRVCHTSETPGGGGELSRDSRGAC